MDINIIKLTQKLISIPSYVRGKTNEKKIGNFIFNYLQKFSYLKVKKQKIKNGRFNIIAETKGKPKLLLAGHMDTVEPKKGWSKNQFTGTIEKSRLYGLGSADMKAGIAAILDSLNDFTKISGLSLLFYCDEEYDFIGMRKFVADYKKEIGDLAIIAEPKQLEIGNAHRGLIEISFSVQGKTGHAAKPESGNNAINGITDALTELKKYLSKFKDSTLGIPALNIAYLRGGLNLDKKNDSGIILGREGNNIADFAEAIIDIRPTKPELSADIVVKWLKQFLKKRKFSLIDYSIRHDLGSFYTDPKEIKNIEKIIKENTGKVKYINPMKSGYGDGQMLQEKYNIPVIYFGPSGKNYHGINEWVNIPSIKKCKEIFSSIIKKYCQYQ